MRRRILLRDDIKDVEMGTGHQVALQELGIETISAGGDGTPGLIRLRLTSGQDPDHPWYGDEPVVTLSYAQAQAALRSLAAGLDAIDRAARHQAGDQ